MMIDIKNQTEFRAASEGAPPPFFAGANQIVSALFVKEFIL